MFCLSLSLSLLYTACRYICGKGSNKELISTKDVLSTHLPDCPSTSDCQLEEVKGIEVGLLLSLDHPCLEMYSG